MSKKNSFFKVALFSSLICCCCLFVRGKAQASSEYKLKNSTIQKSLSTDPTTYMCRLFENIYQKNDFTDDSAIIATQDIIAQSYPGRPDLYKKAVLKLGELLKKQKKGFKHKYKEAEVDLVVTYMLQQMDEIY